MSAAKVLSLVLDLSVRGTEGAAVLERRLKSIADIGSSPKLGKKLFPDIDTSLLDQGLSKITANIEKVKNGLAKPLSLDFNFFSIEKAALKIEAVKEKIKELDNIKLDKAINEFNKLQEKAKALEAKKIAIEVAISNKVLLDEGLLKITENLEKVKNGLAKPLSLDFNFSSLEKAALKIEAIKEKTKELDNIKLDKAIDEFNKLQEKAKALENKKIAVEVALSNKVFQEFKTLENLISATKEKARSLGLQEVSVNVNSKNVNQLGIELDRINPRLKVLNALIGKTKQEVLGLGSGGGGSGDGGGGFSALSEGADKSSVSLRRLASTALLVRNVLFAIGAINLAKQILDITIAFDSLNAKFDLVFGKQKAAEEFAFIKKEADRLGLSVTDLGNSYGNLVQATKNTTISQKDVKRIFIDIAQAGSQLSLSQEAVARSFTAVEQIASKGKVQLEEIKGQLGDSLPGALSIFALGLGVTEEKLNSLLTAGISSKTFFESFSIGVEKAFDIDKLKRIDTVAAAVQRFKNSFQLFLESLSKGQGTDAITASFNKLSATFQDPNFQKSVKEIAVVLLNIGQAIAENIPLITRVIALYGALALIGKGQDFLSGVTKGFTSASAAGKAVEISAKGAGTAITALQSLAKAATIIVVASVVGEATINAFFSKLNSDLDKNSIALNKFIDTKVKAIQLDFLEKSLKGQIKALGEYKSVVAENTEVVKKFGVEQLLAYTGNIEGAVKLAKAQSESTTLSIDRIKNEIVANEQLIAQQDLVKNSFTANTTQRIVARAATEALTAKNAELTASLLPLQTQQALQNTTFKELEKGATTAAISLEKFDLNINAIRTDKLSTAQKLLSDVFNTAIKEGKGVAEALDKTIPANFGDGAAATIRELIPTLIALKNEGKITGQQIDEELTKKLAKLSQQGLGTFQDNVVKGFKASEFGAISFATVLQSAVKVSLDNLGIDASAASSKISSAFGKNIIDLQNLERNAQTSGAVLKASFEKVLTTAKTREELELLQKELGKISGEGPRQALALLQKDADKLNTVEGQKQFRELTRQLKESSDLSLRFGKDIADTALRTQDALRLIQGTLDSSLGDSFNRLGIKTTETLNSLGNQALIDFGRISTSGKASSEEVKAAFIKAAAEITAANNGIPPISLRIQAFSLDAFQVLSDTAKTVSEKIKSDFETALSSAQNVAQLNVLKAAITNTFISGRIDAETFGVELLNIRNKFLDVRDTALTAFTGIFSTVAREALTASDQIKTAFDSALGSSGTRAQLEALKSQLEQTFEAGKISSRDFALALDEVNAKITGLTDSVDGNLVGAFKRFGIQTQTELSKVAEQTAKDFQTIQNSGELSAQGLETAFKKYAEAAIEANGGVASSFLEAQANGLGLSAVLDRLINKVSTLESAARNLGANAAPGAVTDKPINQLNIEELAKLERTLGQLNAYQRSLGAAGFDSNLTKQLDQIKARRKEIQDEIAAAALAAENKLTSANDKALQNRLAAAGTFADRAQNGNTSAFSSGSVVNNFYFQFYNSAITPDQARNQFVPIIERITQRKG